MDTGSDQLGLRVWESRLSKLGALIAGIPGVGSIVGAAMGGMLSDVRFSRVEEFVHHLSEQVAELETIDEDYLRTEDFRDIVAETVEAASRQHYSTKREMMAIYIRNALVRTIDYEEHVSLRVSQTLDVITPAEIQLLQAIRKAPDPSEYENMMTNSAIRVLQSRTALDESRVEALAVHLDQIGITQIGGALKAMGTARGMADLRGQVTKWGERFLGAVTA